MTLGNSLTLSYTYHISGAVKTAMVMSADNRELYADTLYYEDCGNNACTPQYNGNISRMAHHLAHGNSNYGEFRDVRYTYDELNRLTKVNDTKQDVFDEIFAYDAQGRITAQRRAGNVVNPTGGEYSYYSGKNRLKTVADNMGGTSALGRIMSDPNNFVYDSEGNLTEDKSKGLKISYDWRGMPVEFMQESQPTGSSDNSLFRLTMAYDGSGRRISKTRWVKKVGSQDWEKELVTHYTGIGTEVRENYAGPTKQTKVVVNMPQGLGRYGIEDAENSDMGSGVGYIPNTKFEWYLKNHLGSTMLVYGTQADANPAHSDIGTQLAAYDYRAFGEMVELTPPPTGKVTENFTGKEHDDEIALDYFGARYLDPMLGMWISVDPARQFASPYLYAGNGMNPVNGVDPDGNYSITQVDDQYVSQNGKYHYQYASLVETVFYKVYDLLIPGGGLMTSSKPDLEIENSLRPSVRSGLFGAILDALTFIPFLRPASIPLSASEKTLKEVKNFNDLYSIITLDNVFFEDFMNQLTGYGIFGSSVENVKVKANWANAYGRKLYDNDVEVTDEVKRQFRDAYKKEFESSDK